MSISEMDTSAAQDSTPTVPYAEAVSGMQAVNLRRVWFFVAVCLLPAVWATGNARIPK